MTQKSTLSGSFWAGMVAIAIGLIAGIWGVVSLLTRGHVAMGVNDQMPWGILVPGYVFFVAASAGCVIVALGYALGIKRFAHIMKRAIFLAIITLLAGGGLIFIELGSPQNAINFILSPNPLSPMGWMLGFYTLYLVMLLIEFYLISTGRVSNLRTISMFTAFSAIAVHSTLGGIFGLAAVRTYWGGALSPVYFILIAMLIGTALLLLVTILTYKLTKATMSSELHALVLDLGKFLGIVLGVGIFFTLWKTLAGLRSTVDSTLIAYQDTVGLWWFWVFVVLIGLVIPIVLLLNSKTRNLNVVALSSVLVLIGMFAARVEFTLGGEIVPVMKDLVHPGFSSHYAPTFVEIAILGLAFSGVALLYVLGARKLELDKVAEHD